MALALIGPDWEAIDPVLMNRYDIPVNVSFYVSVLLMDDY